MMISFADNVRIRKAAATEELGLAGLSGVVYGCTNPYFNEVSVIGSTDSNIVYSVHLAEKDAEFWFAPELLEFVDHGAGSIVTMNDKQWIRRADGDWDETPSADGHSDQSPRDGRS
jgi:hypothetical protein